MINTNYVWNHKIYRKLAINTRTGKPLPTRRIKAFYGARDLAHIVHGVGLKPGDIVQTCRSYFNQRISKIEGIDYRTWPEKPSKKNIDLDVYHEKFIVDVNFTTEDGYYHGWDNCCNKPLSVEKITKWHFDYSEKFIESKFENSFYDRWYGSDKADAKIKWENEFIWCKKVYNSILANKPICDEFGIELPELSQIKLKSL